MTPTSPQTPRQNPPRSPSARPPVSSFVLSASARCLADASFVVSKPVIKKLGGSVLDEDLDQGRGGKEREREEVEGGDEALSLRPRTRLVGASIIVSIRVGQSEGRCAV